MEWAPDSSCQWQRTDHLAIVDFVTDVRTVSTRRGSSVPGATDFGVTSVHYDFAELRVRAEVPW